ncbi:MAG: hypothetical protein KatS3mg131_3501 [Candidatus Tectimicrobiota bacterium]|nr:MAG: hypothetical protein KatS3mg131_3501 [Candidatus Tectomicrobia bacterium]
MTYTDVKGLPVSTTSAEALAAYEQGIDRFLRWHSGALQALEAAVTHDPHFALAHCARAYIAWRMGHVETGLAAHDQALAAADHVRSEREHLHVQVVHALRQGESATALSLLEQLAAAYPTDRLAVRLLGLTYLAQGHYEGGIAVARRSLEASPHDPQFQTMLGFFLEQAGYNDEGLALSRRALAQDPTNLYAYHAVGHAYQARGDYREALETFARAVSLERYPHLLWHLAEAQAILGHEQLTRAYWGSTTPPLPLHERVALLWRLEVVRHRPAEEAIWEALADEGERLLAHAPFLTVWMRHWIALALGRAGAMAKAQAQVARLRQLPAGRASGYWSTLGADLLAGELAFIEGDVAGAVARMAPAIAQLDTLGGGSREQKDIFRDVFLELQRRLGNAEAVVALAQQRLLANPNHLPSLAALVWAYGKLGHAALQRQVCRQLVQRAEVTGVHPEAPELRTAQQLLQQVP